jgi:hypothetical protein
MSRSPDWLIAGIRSFRELAAICTLGPLSAAQPNRKMIIDAQASKEVLTTVRLQTDNKNAYPGNLRFAGIRLELDNCVAKNRQILVIPNIGSNQGGVYYFQPRQDVFLPESVRGEIDWPIRCAGHAGRLERSLPRALELRM